MRTTDAAPFDRDLMDPPADAELEAKVPERFKVDDDRSANWVVRQVVEARAYAERVKHWAEAETRRARRQEHFFLRRFGPELDDWLTHELGARRSPQKSINLPAGRLGRRTINDKLVIDDEAAALDWARHHLPEAVKTVEQLRKSTLNQQFFNSGELPPGTSLEPQHQTLTIT